MEIFRENTQGTGGGAFQELWISVGNFGCMLGLELDVPWGHEFSPNDERPL
jgi:hypothetical protein